MRLNFSFFDPGLRYLDDVMVLLCLAVNGTPRYTEPHRVQMPKVTLALVNSTGENCLDQSPQHVSIFTGSVC